VRKLRVCNEQALGAGECAFGGVGLLRKDGIAGLVDFIFDPLAHREVYRNRRCHARARSFEPNAAGKRPFIERASIGGARFLGPDPHNRRRRGSVH
jgi:hypothetical protein